MTSDLEGARKGSCLTLGYPEGRGELKGHSQAGVTSATHSHTFPGDHCRQLGEPQFFHYSSCWADLAPGAVGKVSSVLRC